MDGIFSQEHIIRNFPKKYATWRKVRDNALFFTFSIVVHPRKNLLTQKDMMKAKSTLRRGDIVLIGDLKTAFASLIKDPITHSAIYVGSRKFIHAVADGVCYTSLHDFFSKYDTMIILRANARYSVIENAIKYAENQIGKPYNYAFREGHKSFFCAQLVNDAYKHANYKTKLISVSKPKKWTKKLKDEITGAVEALHPMHFLVGNFDIKFMSHDLRYKNQELTFFNKDYIVVKKV